MRIFQFGRTKEKTTHSVVPRDTLDLKALVKGAIAAHGPWVDLNHIDVSKLQDFENVFMGTSFNGNISRWKTDNAWCMRGMFLHSAFNGDISQWNVNKLQDADDMFRGSPFNGDVSQWRPGNLYKARHMLDTPSFQGDLSQWTIKRGVMINAMLHSDFQGQLPAVITSDAHDAYALMFGGESVLAKYAARTPFARVHADLLVAASDKCSWASQEMVRWAREGVEMGRAVGMNNEEISNWLVEQHAKGFTCNATEPIDSGVFDWNIN